MVDYLTFLDLWSGTLKLKIAFRPEGGSLIVIVVKSWNAQGDVAPFGACRPWIFFINEVLCFLKINERGMEKEER